MCEISKLWEGQEAKQKKSHVHGYIYMKCPEKANLKTDSRSEDMNGI